MSKTFEVIFKEFHNSETFVMSRSLLEDYKTKAAAEEQTRIVSLLEQYIGNGDPEGDAYLRDAIAIIKGEME
jgi:hypothetical protein